MAWLMFYWARNTNLRFPNGIWCCVLSLPANHRKDIFEKAQRQRRLLARKQFIPVAADPIKY